MFDLGTYDDDAEYAIFDDWDDWSRLFNYKGWLGAQKEFTVTDKYRKKQTVRWKRPCIVLANQVPDFKDQAWIERNCVTVFIQHPLFEINETE